MKLSTQNRTAHGWLFAPIILLAISQASGAAGSVLLGVAYPSYAPLIFGPQALGGLLIAGGFAAFAVRLPYGPARSGIVERRNHLRGAIELAAVGFTLYAVGWAFYVVDRRDEPASFVIAAFFNALSVAIEATAFWWVVKRMKAAGNNAFLDGPV